ncbi:hypothetical protein [Candidatus Electronema sp. JM]|uniref:hypothetical protein n=1 Tax=Candidatus Electronema sp. JM TaxID=3401571 RepID=UPI003AA8CF92
MLNPELKDWAAKNGFAERPCRRCAGPSADNCCEECGGLGAKYAEYGESAEYHIEVIEEFIELCQTKQPAR